MSLMEKSLHFFKVILPPTLEEKKLEIPEMFVKKFGDEFSDIATLEVPNGEVWLVRLSKDGGKIWFQDGWQNFVKYHSISVGYFLVFKFVKNSTFQVLIFDSTACDIHHPYNAMRTKPQSNADSSKLKPENKCKMVEKAKVNEAEYENKYHFLSLLEEMGIYATVGCKFFSEEEQRRAIHFARLFKPKNPSFMAIFRFHSSGDRRLSLPVKFVDKYLGRNPRTVKLLVPDGRELCVEIKRVTCGGFRLTKGWIKFSREEILKQGDIGFFELIDRKPFILKLSVYPASAKLT